MRCNVSIQVECLDWGMNTVGEHEWIIKCLCSFDHRCSFKKKDASSDVLLLIFSLHQEMNCNHQQTLQIDLWKASGNLI